MHVRTLIFIFTLSITGPIYSQTSMLIPRPLVETLKQVSAPLKKVSQALARIKIKNKSQTFYASGFFFGNKETLVTNYHVISPDQKCLETKKCNLHLELVKNELQLSQLDAKAELILVDKKLDLAILRIKNHKKLEDIMPLKIATKTSQQIVAVGFYHNNSQLTFSTGQLLSQGLTNTSSIIIGAGFSGAPVVNQQGEAIGIVTSYRPLQGQSIGLAQFINIDRVDKRSFAVAQND